MYLRNQSGLHLKTTGTSSGRESIKTAALRRTATRPCTLPEQMFTASNQAAGLRVPSCTDMLHGVGEESTGKYVFFGPIQAPARCNDHLQCVLRFPGNQDNFRTSHKGKQWIKGLQYDIGSILPRIARPRDAGRETRPWREVLLYGRNLLRRQGRLQSLPPDQWSRGKSPRVDHHHRDPGRQSARVPPTTDQPQAPSIADVHQYSGWCGGMARRRAWAWIGSRRGR